MLYSRIFLKSVACFRSKRSAVLRWAICLSLFTVFSPQALAQGDRIHQELAEPGYIIPLKNALGEEKFNEAMASGKYRYTGNIKCRLCHREFFLGRKQDPHDHAYKDIVKKGYGDNPECLGCHATGFGVDTGFVDFQQTPRLANVQCEGCHGPGNIHIEMRSAGGFLAGTDRPDLIRKMCLSCHNERWDRSFKDFEEAYNRYKSPIPH